MSFQGNTLITMTTASTITRGEILSGAGTLSATLRGVGVCYDITDTDCVVAIDGTVLIELGATLTAGATVKASATGKAVASSTDHNLIVAVLLEGGVSGDLVAAKVV